MKNLETKSLANRTFIAVMLAALAVSADWVGGFIWAGFILMISLLAVREFSALCKVKKIYPSKYWMAMIISAFIITPVFLRPEHVYACQGFLIALSFTLILLRMFLRVTSHTKFADVSASLWSMIYLGFLPSFFVWIRGLDQGFELILIIFSTVIASDVAAMIFGKLFGRIPLSPQISPNKTIEGSVAGLVCSSLVFLSLVKFFGFNLNLDLIHQLIPSLRFENLVLIAMGFIIAVLSQIGDLLESLFKREVGVKDSGTIFESHGGVLDRMDSHFFSVWVAYLFFRYLIV